MEGVCGWCGSSECDWKVYGGELHETAARLMSTIYRQPRRNHEVRAIRCRKYIYMKTGSMSGTVPECVYCGELNYAHEAKQIIQMLSYIAFTRAPVYIDFCTGDYVRIFVAVLPSLRGREYFSRS
ncbi:hypothetical protein JG687_00013778 [Phytophthora cactorum]|uniref:Uncharacterized protein n=1 Tax=Phytophthora cactorum TaxID=29920 RepID=A0A8T1U0E1_9STRA|nr:hypothetical protein JG687_00013778 [Phytophthora cactorum]